MNRDLFGAAVANNFASVQTLVTRANVNALRHPTFGWTLLHAACTKNNHDLVVWLINMKADINAPDIYLNTPLHVAALKGSSKNMQVLLAAGANPRLANKLGELPLHRAASSINKGCVALLLDAYPDGAKHLDLEQQTAFSATVFYSGGDSVGDSIAIARLLLDAKSNIEQRTTPGHLPLSQALLVHDDKMIELLLDRGASYDAVLKAYEGKRTIIYRRAWIENILAKRKSCRDAAWAILNLGKRQQALRDNDKNVLSLIAKWVWESRKNKAWSPAGPK
jgi:ankyrin repeat protein